MIRGNRPSLSAQERALLVYLAQGLRAKQIAADVLCERYQLVPVRQANIIEDRREERMDALRSAP